MEGTETLGCGGGPTGRPEEVSTLSGVTLVVTSYLVLANVICWSTGGDSDRQGRCDR